MRSADAGDAPAMVVKSQWRMKASGNYRDFADDEFSTPLLLYPVRQRRDDEGTTAMEFHLRPSRRCPNWCAAYPSERRERLEQVERQHRQYE